jgi:hypothetical protein
MFFFVVVVVLFLLLFLGLFFLHYEAGNIFIEIHTPLDVDLKQYRTMCAIIFLMDTNYSKIRF